MEIRMKSRNDTDWRKTLNFLAKDVSEATILRILEKYGKLGVKNLSAATPKDSGRTATAWKYEVVASKEGRYEVAWYNTNQPGRVSVAILIQYGHATKYGGYVPPHDYVNPCMVPILKRVADELIREIN